MKGLPDMDAADRIAPLEYTGRVDDTPSMWLRFVKRFQMERPGRVKTKK